MSCSPCKIYYVLELPTCPYYCPQPNAIYFLNDGSNKISMYVTNQNGKYFLINPPAQIPPQQHNSLQGLQGGTDGEYYHLTESQLSTILQFLNSEATGLISIGSIEENGLDITYENVVWKIQGTQFDVTSQEFNITAATDGYYRTDIIVGNNSGQLQLIEGSESQTNPVIPTTPANTALISVINVFGDTVQVPPDIEIPSLQQVIEVGRTGVVNGGGSILLLHTNGTDLASLELNSNSVTQLTGSYTQVVGFAGLDLTAETDQVPTTNNGTWNLATNVNGNYANDSGTIDLSDEFSNFVKKTGEPYQEVEGRLYASDGFGTSTTGYPRALLVPSGVSVILDADSYAQLTYAGIQTLDGTTGFILGNPSSGITTLYPPVRTTPGIIATEDYVNSLYSWATPQQYGAIGDGVVDDTDAVKNCLDNNKNVLLYDNYKVRVNELNVREDQFIFSNNATFTNTITSGIILTANGVNNWKIQGKLTFIGAGNALGTQRGIYIIGCTGYKIEGVTFRNISGDPIEFDDVAPIQRGNAGLVYNISAYNNYGSVLFNRRAEYITVQNVNIMGSSTVALKILSGNVTINGGSIVDNANGVFVGGGGANNSHGILANLNSNHNDLTGGYNLLMDGVDEGHTVTGCHFYGNSTRNIEVLANSKAVSFIGCTIAGKIDIAGTATHLISSCQINDGITTLVGGNTNTIQIGNFNKDTSGWWIENSLDPKYIHTTGNQTKIGVNGDAALTLVGTGFGTLKLLRGTKGAILYNPAANDGLYLANPSASVDYQSWFDSGTTIGGLVNAGYKLDVIGTGRFTDQLTVPDATASTSAVNLGQLQANSKIKTTASSTPTTVVNTAIATSYRLNPGVTDVTLPPLTGNSGVILFFVNNTGADVDINSNAGGNDIWAGGANSNTVSVTQGTIMRILHDGTDWTVL